VSKNLPKEKTADDWHLAARATLSTVPFVGGAAVELFNRLLAPPIERRREAWLNNLADRLSKLEQAGRLNIGDLNENDEFVTTVMRASQVAVRNHQKEKIVALSNAVLNTALGDMPECSVREMFIGFVDEFTVWHMRILGALAAADSDAQDRPRVETSVRLITDRAVSMLQTLRKQRAVAEIAVQDLCQRRLLFWNREGLVTYIRPDTTQVTELGRDFLHFITEPKENV